MSTVEIRPISARETHDLRHRILRPHQSLTMCAFPYDTASGALHIGCFLNKQLLGIGSILPDPRENATQPTSWRIRGMAVLEEARGTGAGGKILQALIDYASSQQLPAEIWCNGRTHVQGFYEHFGFAQEGNLFDLPGIGPHVLMVKTLPASH
ncbi:MAG TPA: GNAT family N-acetyltransferase [Ktedonobacteraceae bacterium]